MYLIFNLRNLTGNGQFKYFLFLTYLGIFEFLIHIVDEISFRNE